jgi:branched-chain amino acid transport system substrate-binding protein
MNKSVLMLIGGLLAVCGVGCRKSESTEATPSTEQQAAAPAAVKEIRIGQVMPYSGPASAFGSIGKLHAKFFDMVNRKGGVNGYQIKFISEDDSYSPPKAVEQVRKLVEQDKVVAIFNPVGTPSNIAVQKYLNEKGVAQLFVATGAGRWNDPKNYPFTIGFNPSYRVEGKAWAEDVLRRNPKAKVAVLLQNDEFGRDALAGFKEALGDKAKTMIVAEATYEPSDPTVDSQIATLKGSKADTFLNIATPKFAAQAIRKVADLRWKPQQYLVNVSANVGTVFTPAGLDNARGIITANYLKDPNDPALAKDPGVVEWREFMKTEFPEGRLTDLSTVYAYVTAQTLMHVLERAGSDFSAKNLMAQAAQIKDFAPPLLLDGVKLNSTPDDFELFDQLQLGQFDGARFQPLTARH